MESTKTATAPTRSPNRERQMRPRQGPFLGHTRQRWRAFGCAARSCTRTSRRGPSRRTRPSQPSPARFSSCCAMSSFVSMGVPRQLPRPRRNQGALTARCRRSSRSFRRFWTARRPFRRRAQQRRRRCPRRPSRPACSKARTSRERRGRQGSPPGCAADGDAQVVIELCSKRPKEWAMERPRCPRRGHEYSRVCTQQSHSQTSSKSSSVWRRPGGLRGDRTPARCCRSFVRLGARG
jgi:hypothetical protein